MNKNWNLNVVFASQAMAEKTMERVLDDVKDFRIFYEYRLRELTSPAIDVALKRYIELMINAGRVNDYAYL